MNWLLIANNLTTATLVLSCWWLAHANARSVMPGKIVAVLYAATGLSVLATGVARNFPLISDTSVPWLIVGSKILISGIFIVECYRKGRLERMMAESPGLDWRRGLVRLAQVPRKPHRR